METHKKVGVDLSFAIVKTGDDTALEGLTYAGGSFRRKTQINYVAILVRHPKGRFLLDSGLGSTIDAQFQADMPWWKKLLLHYDHLAPAKAQLEAHDFPPIRRIFLSMDIGIMPVACSIFPKPRFG